MVEDVVRELGFLTLGSRFRRIGERLQAQTQDLLQQASIDVPASLLPLLAALGRLGPLSVGGLSQALGVSQPGVTRQLATLQQTGLVRSAPCAHDARQREVSLTAQGRRLVVDAQVTAWPAVEAAVVDACGPGGPMLLKQLALLEDALAACPLRQRAPGPHATGADDASA